MPAALDIDREAVRVLVVAIGPRAAARELGLPEATVQAWSARGGWLEKHREMQEIGVIRVREREALQGRVQPIATKSPATVMQEAIEDLSTRSKIGFAKASCKVAEELAGSEPGKLLLLSQEAQHWAKTAALAGGWAGAGTTVNVAVALRMDME